MTNPSDKRTPADPRDLDDASAFAPGVDAERPVRRADQSDAADEQASRRGRPDPLRQRVAPVREMLVKMSP
jgi:hypothetical protein